MKYRKKPVEVIAHQVGFDYDRDLEIMKWCGGTFEDDEESPILFYIETLEGKMAVMPEDYVIQGVEGEFYPCKPYIFEATYERVEGES